MQKIIWIGAPYFAECLAECGWKTHLIYPADGRVYCWKDLVQASGFEPDVVVVGDHSRPPFVLGVESFPCLTVFYSVDSHIHSWHPIYAQAFDSCLVSLHDHIEKFAGPYLPPERVWWSPPFAKTQDHPGNNEEKIWDCLFVGSVKPDIMPKRHRFLTELAEFLPALQIKSGNYRELFSYAKTLVNHAERGDLNFRVFEALGCGGCLVTPAIGHGQDTLFVDGEHLICYAQDDAEDAAKKIRYLLEHPKERERISQNGYAEVNRRHRAIHRAKAFTEHMEILANERSKGLVERRRAMRMEICKNSLSMLYLLWANEMALPNIKESFLAASRGMYGLNGCNE